MDDRETDSPKILGCMAALSLQGYMQRCVCMHVGVGWGVGNCMQS